MDKGKTKQKQQPHMQKSTLLEDKQQQLKENQVLCTNVRWMNRLTGSPHSRAVWAQVVVRSQRRQKNSIRQMGLAALAISKVVFETYMQCASIQDALCLLVFEKSTLFFSML
jgi:hypothetical protein